MIRSVLFDGRETPASVRVTAAEDAITKTISYVGVKVGVDVDAMHPQTCVTLILDETMALSLYTQLGEALRGGRRRG